jgi:hypothetical protein
LKLLSTQIVSIFFSFSPKLLPSGRLYFDINNLAPIGKVGIVLLLKISINLINFLSIDKKLIKFIEIFNNKTIPTLPIGAKLLMSKYNLPEGKSLGEKLKKIETIWVDNNFKISEKQIQNIVKN